MTAADFSKGAAWIEGQYVPIAEARIPILDRGFTRSDCTYDVYHVWKGLAFRLEDHMERLERNMAAFRLKLPMTRDEMRDISLECVRLTGLRDAFVSLTVTRGMTPGGSRDPRTAINRLYVYVVPFVWIADEEKQKQGMNLWISQIQRIPPASVDPRTKNYHWGDLTMGLFEAYDNGCDIDVLVDGEGNVTEGPGFNIFVLKGGRLHTPLDGVFDGMTRRTIIDLAPETNVTVEEGPVPVETVQSADEIFITSTAGGVMPVTKISGRPVGDGSPGPLTQRLNRLYWSKKEAGWLGTPVDYSLTGGAA
jgi:branched-chain amino acid aminotransferase